MKDATRVKANSLAVQIKVLESILADLKGTNNNYSINLQKFMFPVVLPSLEKCLSEKKLELEAL